MGGERRAPHGNRPARRSAIDIRALLTHREYIKTTTYLLPRRAKVQVLELMERLRRERTARPGTAAEDVPSPLPEMTGGELVREINWRIGTLPPEDAEVVTRHIHRLCRWRAGRTRERLPPPSTRAGR